MINVKTNTRTTKAITTLWELCSFTPAAAEGGRLGGRWCLDRSIMISKRHVVFWPFEVGDGSMLVVMDRFENWHASLRWSMVW